MNGKEFRLQVRVKNALLAKAMEAHGYDAKTLAAVAGINRAVVHQYLSLSYTPASRKTGWRITAAKIARVLGVSPEALWPDPVIAVSEHVKMVERDVSADEIGFLMLEASEPTIGELAPAPEAWADREELRAAISESLDSLTAKERDVLIRRFGLDDDKDQTMDEIGSAYGVTRERIRQVEAKALRKLRHPIRSRRLRPWVELDSPEWIAKKEAEKRESELRSEVERKERDRADWVQQREGV